MDRTTKAHVSWIIGLLVALLVLVGTVRMPTAPRLTDLINFAATVSSLILAVYAIFQAALASSEGARSASEARALNARTSAMLESITQSLPEIRMTVHDIKEKVSSGTYAQSAAAQDQRINVARGTDADADVVIENSTPAGLLALQIAVLTFRSKKALPFDIVEAKMMWHSFGVISGLSAAKWMNFFYEARSPLSDTLVVHEINEHLQEKYDMILQRIQLNASTSDVVVNSVKVAAFFNSVSPAQELPDS